MLSIFERMDIIAVRDKLPAVFERAFTDWVKFKLGMERGLFTADQADKALTWFYQFPRLWEAYRPNFVDAATMPSGMVSSHGAAFVERVDRFVADLKESPFRTWVGLGFAPAVIAGVLIVGGIAAALWAVGYVKSQNNISAIIDGVTAGKIPASALEEAIQAEASGGFSGFFGNLGGVAKWAAIGLAIWFLAPPILKALKGSKSA